MNQVDFVRGKCSIHDYIFTKDIFILKFYGFSAILSGNNHHFNCKINTNQVCYAFPYIWQLYHTFQTGLTRSVIQMLTLLPNG